MIKLQFYPLFTRVLAEGKVVLGFGERKSPLPFVNACSKFYESIARTGRNFAGNHSKNL